MRRKSVWFAKATSDGSAVANAAFERVEQLLTEVKAVSLDPARNTADFTKNKTQLDLHHVSGLDMLTISISYSADTGGMFHPLGFEEYYQLRDESPVEQDILDDLGTVLVSAFDVEETYWKERKIRTVVTQVEPGERSSGSSVSGWLLPPRWFLPGSRLTTRTQRYSYASASVVRPSRGL